MWQKHLPLGELCSLSVGLKVLYKGSSKQWIVDVMEKVFCRNPRHNGFCWLKPFILFYRWHSLAGSWAKNQTQVSWDISETLFVHGQSDCLLTWLQNSPECWTVISVPWSSLLIVVTLSRITKCSSCRAWEVQFSIPYRKLSCSSGEGSLGLLLGFTHSFLLYPASLSLILSAFPVVTVGTFWCLLPLLDIFMFSFYMLQNCCLGFREIWSLYQFFSSSLTDSGQEVPGSEYIISLSFFCHPFPRNQLALPNWSALCNSQLMLKLPVKMWKSKEVGIVQKIHILMVANFKTEQPSEICC